MNSTTSNSGTTQQQRIANIQNGLLGVVQGTTAVSNPYNVGGISIPTDPYAYTYTPEHMIAMRLHIPHGGTMPFECLHAHRCTDRVVVFLVHKDQSVVIDDDPVLFPSDALIAQLRIIIG